MSGTTRATPTERSDSIYGGSESGESGDSSGRCEQKRPISSGISTLRRAIGESESRILLRQTDSRKAPNQKSRELSQLAPGKAASATSLAGDGAAQQVKKQQANSSNNNNNKDNNEDAHSATTTTSDVDSEDDATSIVSRLSQIIVEQEGKLQFASDLLAAQTDADSGGDFSCNTLGRNSPITKDIAKQQQQQPQPQTRCLKTAMSQGPKCTRYMTARTRRHARVAAPPVAALNKQVSDLQVTSQSPTINVVACGDYNEDDDHVRYVKKDSEENRDLPRESCDIVNMDATPSKGMDSSCLHKQQVNSDDSNELSLSGRSRAKSMIDSAANKPEDDTGGLFIRRNESSGHLPERGDLRTLEQSRKAHGSIPGLRRDPTLARSKSIRAGSFDKLNNASDNNLGDSGELMLNIQRSTWTLSEFDQTFNKSATTSDSHTKLEGISLERDASQASHLSSATADSIVIQNDNSLLATNLSMSTIATGCNAVNNLSAALPVASQPSPLMKNSLSSAIEKQMPSANLLIRASKNAQHHSAGGTGPVYGNLLGDRLQVNKVPSGELEYDRRHSAVSFASSLDSFWSNRHGFGGRDSGGGGGGVVGGKNRKRRDSYNNLDNDDDNNNNGCCGAQRCFKSFFNMQTLGRYLPIVEWLPSYNLSLLWSDLVAGIVVAVLNISTSLSAAVVAETDLGVAFRASIVNTFVYAILCSSRHTSFGSWSIMSQMLLVSVRRALSDELLLSRLNIGPSRSWDAAEYEHWHLNIIIMYTFLIGLVQLLGGLLKLGNILASFIPDALCSSMIAATAFTMAIGQLANMCGTSNKILWSIERNTTALWADLKHPPVDITDLFAGLFRWIQQIALLIKYHEQINLVCVLISVVSVIALFLNQYVIQKQLERQFKKTILIPFEMILLIVMIIISYSLDLRTNFSVATCSPVYIDFSIPTWPNLKLVRELWFESLATALISYTMVCIMAKTYSNKLNYEVDCNQELIACGAGNLIGGLFDALPATASLSRTAGQVEAGGQTQMASIINCIVLYIVAQLLGHHVAVLPVCVMSATLFYGFVRMLSRFSDVFVFWRVCKVDFAIWIVTFVAILTSDLVNGFVYGFIFSILTLLYRAQNRRCYMLGTIGSADVYVPLVKYPVAQEIESIKIFQFCGPINYVSADMFERLLRQKTRVNVKQIHRHIMEQGKGAGFRPSDLNLPTFIILDFSMISYIDSAGIHTIKKIIDDYLSINITILLASLASHVAKVIKKEPMLWEEHKDIFYITLADAVHCAVRENRVQQLQQQSGTTGENCSFDGC